MNTNIPAQVEKQLNLDNIHQAFAQACYCYGEVVNKHNIAFITQENKLRRLAFSAIDWQRQSNSLTIIALLNEIYWRRR